MFTKFKERKWDKGTSGMVTEPVSAVADYFPEVARDLLMLNAFEVFDYGFVDSTLYLQGMQGTIGRGSSMTIFTLSNVTSQGSLEERIVEYMLDNVVEKT
jgi:hypothetical protein